MWETICDAKLSGSGWDWLTVIDVLSQMSLVVESDLFFQWDGMWWLCTRECVPLVYLCFMFSIYSPVKLNTLNVATKQYQNSKILCIDLSIISTSLVPPVTALKSLRSLLTMPTDLLLTMLYITHKNKYNEPLKVIHYIFFVRFIMSSLVSQKPGKS